MVCSQPCAHPLLVDGISFPSVHYHICCHCPLFSTRSVPFPSGMICPTAPKATFLWLSLGGVSMLQLLVLCLAPAHPSLGSAQEHTNTTQGRTSPQTLEI